MSQTIDVTIINDLVAEGTENFMINLGTNSEDVIISDGQGDGNIEDDDAEISINNVSVNEGNAAKGKKNAGNPTYKNFQFNIWLTNAVGHTVTVEYDTADGTATIADADYQAADGTVTFAPGETSKTINVVVLGDNTVEDNEDFYLVLSNASGAEIHNGGMGIGEIVNDDSEGGGNGNGRNKAVTATFAVVEIGRAHV